MVRCGAVAFALMIAIAWARPAWGEPPPPTISIATQAYSVAHPGPWKHTFYIYVTNDGDVPLSDVKFAMQKLEDSTGARQIDVQVDAPKSVVGGDHFNKASPVSVQVTATLDSVDKFTASIFASAGGASQTLEVSVEVKAPTSSPISQNGQAFVETVLGEPVSIVISLANGSDSGQTLKAPTVEGRFEKKAGTNQLEHGGAVARETEGDLVFAPHGSADLPVSVSSLNDPGEYLGHLRVIDKSGTVASVETHIFVKRSWLWAFGFIAAGLALTAAVTMLRDQVLNRQELRVNLARIRDRLAQPLFQEAGDGPRAACLRLKAEAADLENEINVVGKDATKQKIEAFAKRELLLEEATHAAISAANVSAGPRRDFMKTIDEALKAATDPTFTDVDARIAALRQLAIDDAARGELQTAFDALQHAIDEQRGNTDPLVRKEIVELIDPLFVTARSALERDDLDRLRITLGQARDALAKIGLDSMKASLASKPSWVDDETWKAKAVPLQGKLSAAASAAYPELRTEYLAAVEAMTTQVAGRIAEKAGGKGTVSTALVALAGTSGAERLDKLRRLRQALVSSASSSDDGAGETGDELNLSSLDTGGTTGAANPIPDLPVIPEKRVAPRASPPARWQDLRRAFLATNLSLTGVVLLIAAIGGLKLLWADNATWGSTSDLLTAFIWGTTAKLSADAFTGLAGLREALGKA